MFGIQPKPLGPFSTPGALGRDQDSHFQAILIFYIILNALHWWHKDSHLRLLLETEQSSADAESSGWKGTAGRLGRYRGLPRVRMQRKTPLPFRGISKHSGCVKTRASSQLDRARHTAAAHVHPEHPRPRALPARSRSRTAPGHDPPRSGTAPARRAGPARPGLDVSFFQSCFPLVLSSSGGMGKTPSAPLRRRI